MSERLISGPLRREGSPAGSGAVAAGDRFTAWRSGPDRVEFFFNGQETGKLTDDASLFLDIWLGPESRDSRRRDRMLEGDCDD